MPTAIQAVGKSRVVAALRGRPHVKSSDALTVQATSAIFPAHRPGWCDLLGAIMRRFLALLSILLLATPAHSEVMTFDRGVAQPCADNPLHGACAYTEAGLRATEIPGPPSFFGEEVRFHLEPLEGTTG